MLLLRPPVAPSQPSQVLPSSGKFRIMCAQTAHPSAGYDLVLSSGFLSFAAHSVADGTDVLFPTLGEWLVGFLQAVEDVGLPVRGVMGTSSGALIGSMYCAGHAPAEIAAEFQRVPPIQRVAPSPEPWTGLLTLEPAASILRGLLPATFEELKRDFACGVVSLAGRHTLVDSGCLPEAVVASAAVPVLFSPVHITGREDGPYVDGGVACRIGLDLWQKHRSTPVGRSAVVHLIARSSPFSGNDSMHGLGAKNAVVVCSPKSNASLWDLKHFDEQFEDARRRALPMLRQLAMDGNVDVPPRQWHLSLIDTSP